MHFDLVDSVLELEEERIVTLKQVTAAEEYLQDHFPTFPILPGVLMIESMVQAARRLLVSRDPSLETHVLGEVRAVKYGAMVKPGQALRVEVRLSKSAGEVFTFKGTGCVVDASNESLDGATAVSGRFSLRPLCVRVRDSETVGTA